LVTDGFGSPTTITILPDEILNVTYELKIKQPETDFVGSVSGYSYIIRTALADNTAYNNGWSGGIATQNGPNRLRFYASIGEQYQASTFSPRIYTGDIRLITQEPSGEIQMGAFPPIFVINTAYVPGSHKQDFILKFGPLAFNATMRSLLFSFGPTAFQMQVTPDITKTNLQELSFNLSFSWVRE
jgi:hypothetical protein